MTAADAFFVGSVLVAMSAFAIVLFVVAWVTNSRRSTSNNGET